MNLERINNYYLERDNIQKMDIKVIEGIVVETKEVYLFEEDEGAADQLIDENRLNAGFLGATKKHKPEKVSNKTGEVTSPESWTVTIKLKHV